MLKIFLESLFWSWLPRWYTSPTRKQALSLKKIDIQEGSLKVFMIRLYLWLLIIFPSLIHLPNKLVPNGFNGVHSIKLSSKKAPLKISKVSHFWRTANELPKDCHKWWKMHAHSIREERQLILWTLTKWSMMSHELNPLNIFFFFLKSKTIISHQRKGEKHNRGKPAGAFSKEHNQAFRKTDNAKRDDLKHL